MRSQLPRFFYVVGSTALLFLLASCATSGKRPPTRGATAKTQPFLWEIAGPTPSYLFGTMHVSDPRVTTLAPSVKRALKKSQVIYIETRQSDTVGLDLKSKVLRQEKTPLAALLGAKVYAKAKAYFGRFKLPMKRIEPLKIWMVTIQVSLFVFAKYRRGFVLDQLIERHAIATKKRVISLETPLVVFKLLDALSVAEQVSLLRLSLDQLASLRKAGTNLAEQMIVHYARGDAKRLEELLNLDKADAAPVMKKYVDLLLARRNLNWLKKIVPALRAQPARMNFFAVGAGHMLGTKGLVALLRARGFKVRRLGYR